MDSRIIFIILFVFTFSTFSFADRQLNTTESLELIRHLADNNRGGWLIQGALTAQHLVYHASDGIVIQSSEVVRCDGDHFLREVQITEHNAPRKGSLQASQGIVVDAENMKLNQHRIFSWDGKKYSCYYPDAKYADICETVLTPADIDKGVLVAGYVPWGQGLYSMERLSALKISVWEREEDKNYFLEIRIDTPESAAILIRLDPERNYSVLRFEMLQNEKSTMVQRYEGYQYLSNSWIPRTITIERYNILVDPPGLVSYEDWNITISKDRSIEMKSIQPVLSDGTLVRYKPSSLEKRLWYQHNNSTDMAGLLAEKLFTSGMDPKSSNCATLAGSYIAHQFNIDTLPYNPDVWDKGENTSLLSLKASMEKFGLTATPVKTDIEALRTWKEGRVILHLTESLHYVVLDRIEGDYAWIIDLSSNQFYYRRHIDTLRRQWMDGVALIVTDPSLSTEVVVPRISDEEASNILGSQQGGAGYYDCTDLIQPFEVILCPTPIGGAGGICAGRYWELDEVWGCKPSYGPSSCYGTGFPRGYYADCRNDPFDPFRCIKGDVFALRQIRGCVHENE
ncbi:MAG: hypothetical protein JXA82_10135 [Sedimentisphaerales bacterium]|nr:hypothetical protein [Sedimentisphaerales bacterium]